MFFFWYYVILFKKFKYIVVSDLFCSWVQTTYQVLFSGLADTWSARNTWTIDQLLTRYGDTAFKISQRSVGNISMKLKDYASYINIQHDEDPLYIFDYKVLLWF